MAIIERPLNVGKIDNFTLTLHSRYLAGEVIATANVTTTSANLSIDSFTNSSDVISASCTGISVGEAELHYSWTTATRSGCETNTVVILDC